jgi:hypothetical protein
METFKELHLRYRYPMEYFISYRLSFDYPKKMVGHLIYIRENYDGYDFNSGDELDKSIDQLLKLLTINPIQEFKTVLMVDEQLNNALTITSGACEKLINFHFIPTPDPALYEELNRRRALKAYPVELRMTFIPNDLKSINLVVQNDYIIYFPYKDINHLTTIKKI